MSKKFIATAVIALFATAAVAGNVFSMLDADANGAISKEEAAAMPTLGDQWDALDVDANGELSAEEFASYEATEAVSKEAAEMKGEALGSIN